LDAFKTSNIPSGIGLGGDKKRKGDFRILSENRRFVLFKMAPLSKQLRTVSIILTNSIHQLEIRNLKK